MRTTIDLPDELFRRVKATAALRGMKLKDFLAALIGNGLESSTGEPGDLVPQKRTPLPPPVRQPTGKPIPALTNAETEEILILEDAKTGD